MNNVKALAAHCKAGRIFGEKRASGISPKGMTMTTRIASPARPQGDVTYAGHPKNSIIVAWPPDEQRVFGQVWGQAGSVEVVA